MQAKFFVAKLHFCSQFQANSGVVARRMRVQAMPEFSGKTVVITGAGGGLGSALVAHFFSRGARVVACDTPDATLSAEGIASTHRFDLLDADATAAAVVRLLDAEGTPDILINNAGWTRAEAIANLDASRINHEIDLNLTGVLRFTDPVAKAMAARGQGSIVFVSSVNALAHFGNPAYAAAKAGINAYARAIAVELGRSGVRANVVCPGSIRTPAWDHRLERDPGIMPKLQRLYPLGRLVNTVEVAEAIGFLASERASGITGATLPVDAGLTAGQLPFVTDILGA
jgi:NAD(P)-dependent dehydrogenase (short-subunit alcohol dehydrogenase family)